MATSKDFLDKIINSIADPVFVKDRNHRWVYLNEAYCKFMGYQREELLGKSDYDYFPPNQAAVFWAKDELVFETGEENSNEEEFTDAQGKLHTIATKKSLYTDAEGNAYIVGVIREITELKILERELIQSQKMESIGRLSGGLAHDFNNIMMVIAGYCESLTERLQNTDKNALSELNEIDKAAKRASELVKQLLTMSRKQKINPAIHHPNDLIAENKPLLERLIKENIKLIIQADSKTPFVSVDATQFSQVLLNLTANAQDALPNGGKITISTKSQEIGANFFHSSAKLPAGNYAVIQIHDTGDGIKKSDLEYIFEPFYTTKQRGKGTGLGLATTFSIIKQAGGHIRADSELKKGTVFSIYLPEAEEKVSLEPEKPKENKTPPLDPAKQTVLIADDEEGIRKILSMALVRAGYEVIQASNGKEALRLLKETRQPIYFLITDVIMPELGGIELYEKVTKKYPEIKTILISGYTDKSVESLPKNVPFLQKPFNSSKLIEAIGTLGQKSSAA